jgi:4-hydroxyphenylpyruvate dioxygenase-like putative hemolysin
MNQGAGGTARLVGSFGQKFLPQCFFDFIQRMTVVGPGHENLPKLLVL